MFDPGRSFGPRLWRLTPWRRDHGSEDRRPSFPDAKGPGAAFGIVLGLIIAIAFWVIVALLVF